MNHIYRLIWSKVRQAFVVAAETANASGKSASGRLLALPGVALALAGLTPTDALALNECGTGPTVVCDNSGVPASNANPYANGISYTSQDVNLTLSGGAAVNTTTGTPPGGNGPTTVGIGVGIPALTTVSGDASITVEAGASVLVSQSTVYGLVIGGRSTSSPSTGTVVNNGTITFTGAAGGRNIYVETNGDISITNSITGVLDGRAQFGINARDAGTNHNVTVTNNGQVTSTGGSGGAYGILLAAAGATGSASLFQTGTVSTNGIGVGMTLGSGAGSLGTFQNSGSISGGNGGASFNSSNAATQMTATNSGSITASGGYGLRVGQGIVNFDNTGTIVGTTAGVSLESTGTLTNSGTITGTGGTAISVTGSNNALIFTDGSVLNGDVVSTRTGNTILLQGSNSEDSNLTGFDSLTMAGTSWTLSGTVSTTGTTATATNVQTGTLVIAGALTNGGVGGGTTIAPGSTLQIGAGSTTGSIVGNIANQGALVFNRSNDSTYSGTLSGTGSLTKQGAGMTTLDGTGSSQGSVSVAQGSLQFLQTGPFTTTGGYTTQAGATTNIGQLNSTLRIGGAFTQAANSTLDITLGAAPDIVAQSAVLDGTLVISGFSEGAAPVRASDVISGQTYTMLRTTDGITGNFANNPLVPTGLDYLLYSGFVSADTLDYNLGFRLAWTQGGATEGTGTFTMAANTAFNIDIPLGNRTGPFASGWDGQSLTKNGDGLLVLSAANTYTGTTGINGGTLQIDIANAFASSSAVNIASGATLDLNNFNQTANNLSGAGDVTLGSAALTANNNVDTTFSGTISGTGSLTKTGAGALNLTGSDTLSGPTTVAAGLLSVNGTLANSAVQVMSGAALGGNGTVGATTIQSGGTIAPGNSIGTLNINGNYTQAAGSTYQAQVDPNSTASDLIKVSGSATLQNGAVLQVGKITPGEYSLDSRYTVLSAAGGLAGTYSLTGDTSGAFYKLLDSYDANNVYLTPSQIRSFTSAAITPNQIAVSSALMSLPAGNLLKDAVGFLSTDTQARDAFNRLSGDSLASTKTQLVEDSHFVRDAANDRMRQALCSVGGANTDIGAQAVDASATQPGMIPQPNCNTDRPEAWARLFGSWGSTDGNSNAAKLTNSIGGIFGGTDMRVFDTWRAGVMAGYSRSSFKVRDRNSSGTSDNYDIGLYGGTQWGNLGLRLGTSYTWHSIDNQRSVVFPGYADALSARYNASTTQAFAELGYRIDAGKVQAEPFAHLAYVRQSTDRFSEKGSLAALTSSSDSSSTTFSTIGVRATTTFAVGGIDWTGHGTLGWRHAYGNTVPTSRMAFAGSTTYTVSGVPIARDAAVIELGVQALVAKSATIDVAYAGQMGNGMRDHGIRASMNWKF